VAVEAFAQFASNHSTFKKEAISVLTDLLRDNSNNIKNAAIEGLITLEAGSAVGHVKALKSAYAPQYHPFLEKKIRALTQEGDSDTVQKLKKDVVELEARLRKLEDAQKGTGNRD